MASIYRVQVRATAQSQAVVNNFHLRLTDPADGPLGSSQLTDILNVVNTRWAASIAPFLHTDYSVVSYVCSEITGFTSIEDPPQSGIFKKKLTIGFQRFITPTVPVAGEQTGDSLPLTVAAVAHLDTAFAGRRNRGRLKLGPYGELDNTGNQMNATLRDAIKNGVLSVMAHYAVAGIASGLDPVVFSQTSLFAGAAPGSPSDHTALVVGVTVPLTWGTQRTRKFAAGGSL